MIRKLGKTGTKNFQKHLSLNKCNINFPSQWWESYMM